MFFEDVDGLFLVELLWVWVFNYKLVVFECVIGWIIFVCFLVKILFDIEGCKLGVYVKEFVE